ncbi:hypothetical protein [Pseudomonas silesiensis]|nr:hypothetical protein [Pseudomonas silesiensis]
MLPSEPDLLQIVESAAQAHITWLGFHVEGAVAESLPLFREPEDETF